MEYISDKSKQSNGELVIKLEHSTWFDNQPKRVLKKVNFDY